MRTIFFDSIIMLRFGNIKVAKEELMAQINNKNLGF